MTVDISLLNFAKALSGKFSNKDQVQKNPRYFAHINIYYVPLDWSLLNGPWLYSEQSYDYAPWNPYKQAIHKLIYKDNTFIIENYTLKSPERIAGSGFNYELLNDINNQISNKRHGCSMHFREIKNKHYQGFIEPGGKCLIKRGETITYLRSTVEFNEREWISLDEGFDTFSHKKIWGSEHGPLKFRKIKCIGLNSLEKWEESLLWNQNTKL